MEKIQQTAKAIALLDVLISLSTVATRHNYVKPKINERGVIHIKNGRHPVVEQLQKDVPFVPNDTLLDGRENLVAIITGPTWRASPPTCARWPSLCSWPRCSFVPARSARIGIVDRVFTRIGASDDLSAGQSTFMVEMTEVAELLKNATAHSLLILDEIGRGTSTYDGMAIARSVLEYCADRKKLGPRPCLPPLP